MWHMIGKPQTNTNNYHQGMYRYCSCLTLTYIPKSWLFPYKMHCLSDNKGIFQLWLWQYIWYSLVYVQRHLSSDKNEILPRSTIFQALMWLWNGNNNYHFTIIFIVTSFTDNSGFVLAPGLSCPKKIILKF